VTVGAAPVFDVAVDWASRISVSPLTTRFDADGANEYVVPDITTADEPGGSVSSFTTTSEVAVVNVGPGGSDFCIDCGTSIDDDDDDISVVEIVILVVYVGITNEVSVVPKKIGEAAGEPVVPFGTVLDTLSEVNDVDNEVVVEIADTAEYGAITATTARTAHETFMALMFTQTLP